MIQQTQEKHLRWNSLALEPPICLLSGRSRFRRPIVPIIQEAPIVGFFVVSRGGFAAAALSALLLSTAAAQSLNDPLQSAFRLLAEHRYEEAAETFSSFIVAASPEEAKRFAVDGQTAAEASDLEAQRLTLALVGAGQALRQLERDEQALEFFEGALKRKSSLRGETAVRLAAAATAAKIHRHADVLRLCKPLLTSTEAEPQAVLQANRLYLSALIATESPQVVWEFFVDNRFDVAEGSGLWCNTVIQMGFAALQKREVLIAHKAFLWCRDSEAASEHSEMIDFGLCLSSAGGAESNEEAIQRLQSFLASYPTSVHLPRILLATGSLLQRSGAIEDSAKIYQRIRAEYPNSPEAVSAFQGLLVSTPVSALNADVVPEVIRIVENGNVSPALFLVASELASKFDSVPLRNAIAERWVRDRQLRLSAPELMQQLHDRGETTLAVKLAKGAIDQWVQSNDERTGPSVDQVSSLPQATDNPVNGAVISACRVLALQNEWGYLGDVAKKYKVLSFAGDPDGVLLRLLAEGAFQTGDYTSAVPMLDQLIASNRTSDFDTLLRRAEIAMASESKAEAARRISEAKERVLSKSDDALLAILQTQWLIRDTRMEEARLALDALMRSPEVSNELKARAKWLRGETYFLQRQYSEAINEYRSVGSLDESGYWASASLLQSGRAFEQLGRPRDAAICYTGLISANKVGPFADEAKRRLAQIGPVTDKR